jgi:hypothetical protein
MNEYLQANRKRWDELTPLHARSAFYDLQGLRAGGLKLMPLEREEAGDVAGKSLLHTIAHEWPHSLGDVINSLVSVGLQTEFLHEFPCACYRMFPFLEQDEDGWWRSKDRDGSIPMTFSLKATK